MKIPINYVNPIASKILQRRYQMLVHSYIYYDLNDSLISDNDWMEWANELVYLQKEFPEVACQVKYADEFKNFDGSTGFNLDYRKPNIISFAHQLLNERNKK